MYLCGTIIKFHNTQTNRVFVGGYEKEPTVKDVLEVLVKNNNESVIEDYKKYGINSF
jgi:hypothetical protein